MKHHPVAIIGTGPAGLMAADVITSSGYPVKLIEKNRGPGRKLLIAGSSGLNVTYDAPLEEFAKFYRNAPIDRIKQTLDAFSPVQWLEFIEALGIKTFKGTSRRYFIEGMKASTLLRAWLRRLETLGASIAFNAECVGFKTDEAGVTIALADGSSFRASAACFCLGGGSYVANEDPLRFPRIFLEHELAFLPFRASNVGFCVDWPKAFVEEAEGLPLKNVTFRTSAGAKQGDLMITRYGIEGTPVYFYGVPGEATLDLLPDLSLDRIREKLAANAERLSPMRRIKRALKLGPGALALIFHLTPAEKRGDIESLSARLKRFPLPLESSQPLQEAISSAGGLDWAELDEGLMLKRFPRVFAAGEMLNWDAPTGGFLIQGCVSQGFVAGRSILSRYVGK